MLDGKVDRIPFVLVLVLSLSLLAAACGGSSSTPDSNAVDAGTRAHEDGGGSTTPDGAAAMEGGAAIDSGPRPPLSQTHKGQATYYAADGTGNCSFDATPNDLLVAAMNITEYAGSAVCGECVQVTGPSGSTTVRIVDSCPGCSVGSLDLSKQAFAAIAPLSAGRVSITWQVVRCDVSGPIAYRYKEGSSRYYTAIQIRNHRVPIASLEWQTGGKFVAIARTTYDYFVVPNGVGTGSVPVRVTSSDGQILTDLLPPVQPGITVQGAAQFD